MKIQKNTNAPANLRKGIKTPKRIMPSQHLGIKVHRILEDLRPKASTIDMPAAQAQTKHDFIVGTINSIAERSRKSDISSKEIGKMIWNEMESERHNGFDTFWGKTFKFQLISYADTLIAADNAEAQKGKLMNTLPAPRNLHIKVKERIIKTNKPVTSKLIDKRMEVEKEINDLEKKRKQLIEERNKIRDIKQKNLKSLNKAVKKRKVFLAQLNKDIKHGKRSS